MEQIADPDNLREAFMLAARGKSHRGSVQRFRANLHNELSELRYELLNDTLCLDHYRFFVIYDPKRRLICAADFKLRVAFHAIMRVCHRYFEAFQTDDSYASRKGRGQYAALERAQGFCKRFAWYAKLDVRRYFDSIDHDVLMMQLKRMFKDRRLLSLFERLMVSYEVNPRKGLPIGNLTSQYFANHYLAIADHYVREKLHVPAMVRYMDDILIFANDKQTLLQQLRQYEDFVRKSLRLEFHPAIVNRTSYGVPFLGYVVRGEHLRLSARSLKRFMNKTAELYWLSEVGLLTDRQYKERYKALYAFIAKAQIRSLTNKFASKRFLTIV